MARQGKPIFGELLVAQKIITEAQLTEAIERQRASGGRLGRVLIELGYATEAQIAEALARQLKIPYVDLRHFEPKPEIIQLLPEALARRYRAVALEEREGKVLVGMIDPLDLYAYDDLARAIKWPIQPAVVEESALEPFLNVVYPRSKEIQEFAQDVFEDVGAEAIEIESLVPMDTVGGAPIVRLLQSLFIEAIQSRVSDIHIEPGQHALRIRMRRDGVLHVTTETDPRIAPALLQRLKLMSHLDIAEKRLPQDGRFVIRVREQQIDVRLSLIPTQYGEAAALRLLSTGKQFGLDQLGLAPEVQARVENLIRQPHGLLLVTGPTGSGKTTTLYAALAAINRPEIKILTVEDPIEIRLPGILQVQVAEKIGLDFATALRAFLRQDPDVVLIGEMRDEETAHIALRAALTGHFVLSTLHTNDAVSAGPRLLDMKIPPYLLAGALNGVLAQRLVRKLCDNCARPTALTPNERAWLAPIWDRVGEATEFKRGSGCPYCHNTGYRGRQGVFEFLEFDAELTALLGRGDTDSFSRLARQRLLGRTLNDEVVRLVLEGVTSVEEAMRISHRLDT